MSAYSGLIIIINEPRRAWKIEENIEASFSGYGIGFTETLSSIDWSPKPNEFCFISLDGKSLSYASLATRGKKVVTAKYSIRFYNFIDLNNLSFNDISRKIGKKYKSYFFDSVSGYGKRVPPATWKELMDCIFDLRPEISDDLKRLLDKVSLSSRIYKGAQYINVAQEKDAVSLALTLFGADRASNLSTATTPENPASFLKSLDKVKLIEDQIIANDMRVFGDWNIIKDYKIGAIEFEKDNEHLTVVNVNRTQVEKVLGVDLIYYHHIYKSFVMVQYKRLSKDDKIYYPNADNSYPKEYSRMISFENNYSELGKIQELHEYRLNPTAFYFKLCQSVDYNPLSSDLIKGMYIPLDYWKLLLDSFETEGPRGGKAIGYQTVPRYLSNTFFVNLVQSGWIGSRAAVSLVISNIVEKAIAEEHSVFLAASKSSEQY